MNLAQLLREQAQIRPQAVALIDCTAKQKRAITFAELDDAAGRAAALLRRRGLQPGDGVLVFHPMSPDLLYSVSCDLSLGVGCPICRSLHGQIAH